MSVEDVIDVAGSGTPVRVVLNVNRLQETIDGTAEDFHRDRKNWEPVLNRNVLAVNVDADGTSPILVIHAEGIVLGVKGRITQ